MDEDDSPPATLEIPAKHRTEPFHLILQSGPPGHFLITGDSVKVQVNHKVIRFINQDEL